MTERRIILTALVGSRSHGLDTASSDYDYRGIYVLPTESFLGLQKPEESQNQGTDTLYEIGKFLRLALGCNPSVLEIIASPPREITHDGEVLRAMFPLFLSRKRVRDAYRGFAASQKRQALEGSLAPQREARFASHYLRSLYCGIHLLRTGTPLVNVLGTEAEEPCRSAKLGLRSLSECLQRGVELELLIDAAYESSTLPEEADRETVNRWLIDLRLRNF